MEESKRIDLDTLSAEQIDEIAKELGTQLIEIAEETRTKVESLLSKYNLSCKINISLVPKDLPEQDPLDKDLSGKDSQEQDSVE